MFIYYSINIYQILCMNYLNHTPLFCCADVHASKRFDLIVHINLLTLMSTNKLLMTQKYFCSLHHLSKCCFVLIFLFLRASHEYLWGLCLQMPVVGFFFFNPFIYQKGILLNRMLHNCICRCLNVILLFC